MRALETKVAQLVSTSVSNLIPVRVTEQTEAIPKDKLVTVTLETKRQKDSALINVFENIFKIRLSMHFGDNDSQQMEEAGKSLHLALLDRDAWKDESSVLHHSLLEVKRSVKDDMWIQESSYSIVSVDKDA